ncbi:carboxypeptidase C (cathepsin A) [Inhella inkyongensis]|uniref:Carboxypeptidase C (Cathepsin A) n=1 Tax=Inhella inkyongensis TaxID=392593 RepID=A0A840S3K9_9BURK|nr:alpha/beta hydrolase [Inhella inkyongensis]MBB5204313.1 carboxypeptidase C (cathepsin A) [Inhella inkyongensis]
MNEATAALPPATTPAEQRVEREHELKIGRRTLRYRASAGTLNLREPDIKDGTRQGEPVRAQVFYTAYTLLGAEANRPLVFAMNGGPGSSSVWLHLGLLGPQRVVSDEMGYCGAPPYALEANADTLLTHADLVFIDPVGTGYSRMAEGQKEAEYHDYQRDLDAIAEFMRLYLSREGRWGSAKYLLGESYGSTRAAALARQLQEKCELMLNGVVLVSPALDFQTFAFDVGNDLPHITFLPTFAATAWYHQALAPKLQALSLEALLAKAEAFALGPYASALLQGDRLDASAQRKIALEYATLTGLSPDFVQRCRLRVSDERFFKELLRERGEVVGRLDSRFVGHDRDDAGEKAEDDPSYSNLAGAYRVGMQRVLHEQLGWAGDAPYHLLAPLYKSWTWKGIENKYLHTAELLRQALHHQPELRVFVACGDLDLATPPGAALHSLAHMGLRAHLRTQIQVAHYPAGHMMYVHAESRQRLAEDLRAFVQGA